MDEFRCTEPVTLRILQPGLADGEVCYEERSATAVVIEKSRLPAGGRRFSRV